MEMSDTIDRGAHGRGQTKVAAWPRARAEKPATRTQDRPTGLTILALAVAVIGATMLLLALTWVGASDIIAGTRLQTAARVMAPLLVVLAVLEIVLAYGLWELRSWAWPLGIALTIAAMIFTELSAGRGDPTAHLMSLLLEIGTLWYLLSPHVHKALRPGTDRPKP
jgi:hypothetical protein